ncbi:hypothetical protein Tco_1106530, partial [Tanacetum coccineum]
MMSLTRMDAQQTTPFIVSSPHKIRAELNDLDSLKFTDKVMNFLLRVKRAKFVLDKARRWIWKCMRELYEGTAAAGSLDEVIEVHE